MSEIATARSHIAHAYEAAQRGLTGLAKGTTTHVLITVCKERMHQYQAQLITLPGFEHVMQGVMDALEEPP